MTTLAGGFTAIPSIQVQEFDQPLYPIPCLTHATQNHAPISRNGTSAKSMKMPTSTASTPGAPGVEAGPGLVRVKYLRIEPRLKDETLTAWVTVATYHLKN